MTASPMVDVRIAAIVNRVALPSPAKTPFLSRHREAFQFSKWRSVQKFDPCLLTNRTAVRCVTGCAIGKAKSVLADLRSQNPIFFDEIFDHLLLPPVQPTGNRNDEKRKRI